MPTLEGKEHMIKVIDGEHGLTGKADENTREIRLNTDWGHG